MVSELVQEVHSVSQRNLPHGCVTFIAHGEAKVERLGIVGGDVKPALIDAVTAFGNALQEGGLEILDLEHYTSGGVRCVWRTSLGELVQTRIIHRVMNLEHKEALA